MSHSTLEFGGWLRSRHPSRACRSAWRFVATALVVIGCSSSQQGSPPEDPVVEVPPPPPPTPTPPEIVSQPSDQMVLWGSPVALYVSATGTPPLRFQWRREETNVHGTDVPGAREERYEIQSAQWADSGRYAVRVCNSVGSVLSRFAQIYVTWPTSAPAITRQPEDQSVVVGDTATFHVSAGGSVGYYRWRKNGVLISSDSMPDTYTTPPTTLADSGAVFTAEVVGPKGSAASAPAVLTVTPTPVPPSITVQPGGVALTEGDRTHLAVKATGTSPLSYAWTRNGERVAGDVAVPVGPVTLADSGAEFRVTITNSVGAETSLPATVTVSPWIEPPCDPP